MRCDSVALIAGSNLVPPPKLLHYFVQIGYALLNFRQLNRFRNSRLRRNKQHVLHGGIYAMLRGTL